MVHFCLQLAASNGVSPRAHPLKIIVAKRTITTIHLSRDIGNFSIENSILNKKPKAVKLSVKYYNVGISPLSKEGRLFHSFFLNTGTFATSVTQEI